MPPLISNEKWIIVGDNEATHFASSQRLLNHAPFKNFANLLLRPELFKQVMFMLVLSEHAKDFHDDCLNLIATNNRIRTGVCYLTYDTLKTTVRFLEGEAKLLLERADKLALHYR